MRIATTLPLHGRWIGGLAAPIALLPLFGALIVGGIPLVTELVKKLFKMEFGSDLLAGVSILTAVLLAQYLVATIVVVMLSGGVPRSRQASF